MLDQLREVGGSREPKFRIREADLIGIALQQLFNARRHAVDTKHGEAMLSLV